MRDKLHIQIPVPSGISPKYRHLMEKRSSYSVDIPQIRTINNAFVSHYGLVLKNGLLVPRCAFNLTGNEDNTFYYSFWRQTMEEYAVCRWGKSLPYMRIQEPCILIHSKWFNYSFWVNAYLPRIIMAEESGLLEKAVLLIPEGWKDIPYVWETLKAFTFNPRFIPQGVHVFSDTLFMPELRPWTASFYPPLIQRTAERLKTEAMKRNQEGKQFPEHVYLTRKKRGVRCVENEHEILPMLQQHGFQAVVFEDLSVWEQITMMSRAKRFIALHGAGLTNLMFMPPGGKVVELINEAYARVEYTFPFWKLAHAVGLNYRAVFCSILDNGSYQLATKGIIVGNENDYLVNKNVFVDFSSISEVMT
jgi:hypothetical protein